MTRTTMIAAVLAASLTPLARAAPRDGAAGKEGLGVDLRVGAFGGAFDGLAVRRDSGGLALVEAVATPRLRSAQLRLEAPLRAEHRQTFGASLSETILDGAIEPDVRVAPKVRLGAEAGYRWVRRPDWPDLYQRTSDGYLPPTDRYSYGAWRAGLNLYAQPIPHQHLRLRYRYVSFAYVHDPAFDPVLNPMHLTPRDNGQHQVEGSWRYHGEAYSMAFRVDYVHRQDFTYLARDAGTGSTSNYTNPTQQLDDLEPSVEVELKRLGDALSLSFRYGYEVQTDGFQGYYSYAGHHPRVVAAYRFAEGVEGELRGEAWLRTYGPNSKSRTDGGARLWDNRESLRASLSYALGGGLSLKAEGDWLRRDTNYPDYVPGVFPATRSYDIRWDYTNLRALAGVEYRL